MFQKRIRLLPHSSIPNTFVHMNSTFEKQQRHCSLFVFFFSYRFMAFSCYSLHLIRVPNNNIGIWSYSNPSFSWIQIKDFGSIGAGDSYKLAFVHLTCGLKTTWLDQSTFIIQRLSIQSAEWLGRYRKVCCSYIWWCCMKLGCTEQDFIQGTLLWSFR